MNKVFVLICFLSFFKSDVNEFSWKENYKLVWQDFQGKPDKNSKAVAVTASGITFSYSISKNSAKGITGFKTKVFAHFYPEHSWCKEGEINDYILGHEQLHFDITELNTRYLRESIAKLKVSKKIVEELSSGHKQANKDLAAMQKKYDSESDYSMNKEGQAKWIAFINKELKRLERYKSK